MNTKLETINEREDSYLALVIRRFKRHKLAVAGIVIMVIVAILAIAAPLLAPYAPNELSGPFSGKPSLVHLLGTDQVGRDQLSRVIYALRVSLLVGLGSMAIALGIGVILGLVSGYVGGVIDMIIMRVTDIFMAFPSIMLILVLASIIGPGLLNIILILGFLGWPNIARLVRGNVLAIKQTAYIKSSIVMGISTTRILFSHILPNCIAPILVYATSGIAAAIIDEAALSFLGLGVQPPTASLGNMLNNAQSLTILTSKPWLWLPPGLMIILAVLSINFIGDALRDALDPKNNLTVKNKN
jgi:peptide/nickel transport system permease protein